MGNLNLLYEILIILITFIASAILAIGCLRRADVTEILEASLGLSLSLNVLTGYALMTLHLSFSPEHILLGVSLFFLGALTILVVRSRSQPISIEFRRSELVVVSLIWASVFILGMLPSLPSLLPVGIQVDGAGHYDLTNQFVNAIQNRRAFLNTYPSGLHIDLALVTLALGPSFPLAKTIYPFMAMLNALISGTIYLIAFRFYSNRISAILTSFLISTALPTFVQLALQDSWAQVLGFLLLLTIVWMIVVLVQEKRVEMLIPIAILQLALISTYTMFSIIPFVLLLLASKKIQMRPSILGVFVGVWLVYFFTFAFPRINGGEVMALQEAACCGWFNPTAFFSNYGFGGLIALALIGCFSRNKFRKTGETHVIAWGFLALSVSQTLLFVAGFLFLGVALYYVYKNVAYLVIYPLSIFSAFGLDHLLRLVVRPRVTKTRKALAALILLSILLAVSYQATANTIAFHQFPLGLTPDQYAVAVWSRQNLPAGDITFIGNSPTTLWFADISNHGLKNGGVDWWVKPALNFTLWNETAGRGEVVVILDRSLVPSRIDGFRELYHSGDVLVLEKI